MTARAFYYDTTETAEAFTGQGQDVPYQPAFMASAPNYAVQPPTTPSPQSGGFAAPLTTVPPNAYAPLSVTSLPNGPAGPTVAPCKCNGSSSLSAVPLWAWILAAIGVVAVFRRVT